MPLHCVACRGHCPQLLTLGYPICLLSLQGCLPGGNSIQWKPHYQTAYTVWLTWWSCPLASSRWDANPAVLWRTSVGTGSRSISRRSALSEEYSPTPTPVLSECFSHQYWLTVSTHLCWEIKIIWGPMYLKKYTIYVIAVCMGTSNSYCQCYSRRLRLSMYLYSHKTWTNSTIVLLRKNVLEIVLSQ